MVLGMGFRLFAELAPLLFPRSPKSPGGFLTRFSGCLLSFFSFSTSLRAFPASSPAFLTGGAASAAGGYGSVTTRTGAETGSGESAATRHGSMTTTAGSAGSGHGFLTPPQASVTTGQASVAGGWEITNGFSAFQTSVLEPEKSFLAPQTRENRSKTVKDDHFLPG